MRALSATSKRCRRPGYAAPWSPRAPTAARFWPPLASRTCSKRSFNGVLAEREQLQGKPAPDTFLAGAKALGVRPACAAVFEDALAGVEAGRAGRFGFVVGVDRVGQADALRAHGADVVVDDLANLLETP